jgi:hypothetical protein
MVRTHNVFNTFRCRRCCARRTHTCSDFAAAAIRKSIIPIWPQQPRGMATWSRTCLPSPDCHITEACDGMEAFQKAADPHPNIVFSRYRHARPEWNRFRRQHSRGHARIKNHLCEQNVTRSWSCYPYRRAAAYVTDANAATELLPVIAAALPYRGPV